MMDHPLANSTANTATHRISCFSCIDKKNLPHQIKSTFLQFPSLNRHDSYCVTAFTHTKNETMHCVTRQFTYAQLSAAVKVELGFESQPPQKWPFLTVFSKINCQTKIVKLGTWKDSIRFRNVWRLFFCFIPGYTRVIPYVPKMA